MNEKATGDGYRAWSFIPDPVLKGTTGLTDDIRSPLPDRETNDISRDLADGDRDGKELAG